MIDPDKSLIIFSHPRSGSHWVQESICNSSYHKFNLREFFHLKVRYDIDYELKVAKGKLRANNEKICYSTERKHRIHTYQQIQSDYGNVCAKIHVELAIVPDLLSFLIEEKSNTQYILLERKNKMDVFWSDLIASTTNEWVSNLNQTMTGNTEKPCIEIKKDIFERVLSSLNTFNKHCDTLSNSFDMTHVYYEDLLNQPFNKWWNPTNNIFKIQNEKNRTTISNYEQVLEWLSNTGISYENN